MNWGARFLLSFLAALPSGAAAQTLGDPEYGAYLSAECATCHQRDGSFDGIPSITNWPEEDFMAAMFAYRAKQRPHPVMQMLAARLSDEEIAALAAYYATIKN
ncbi:c-type cytochrome [Pseudorhodobacter turbinis]|nr:c-type cytochrome [Pseudorhodobacter turbinis]